jgi:hypothetical protein
MSSVYQLRFCCYCSAARENNGLAARRIGVRIIQVHEKRIAALVAEYPQSEKAENTANGSIIGLRRLVINIRRVRRNMECLRAAVAGAQEGRLSGIATIRRVIRNANGGADASMHTVARLMKPTACAGSVPLSMYGVGLKVSGLILSPT